MKKFLMLLLAAASLSSCADSKTINGVTYEPYGWMNAGTRKNDNVKYDVCIGNVVLDVIFLETALVPVVLTGVQFYEPVGLKNPVPAATK